MQDWYQAVVDADISTWNGLYIEKIEDESSKWYGKYIPKGDDLTAEDKVALNRLLLKTNLFFGVFGPMVTCSTSSPLGFPNLQRESIALLAFTLAHLRSTLNLAPTYRDSNRNCRPAARRRTTRSSG